MDHANLDDMLCRAAQDRRLPDVAGTASADLPSVEEMAALSGQHSAEVLYDSKLNLSKRGLKSQQ